VTATLEQELEQLITDADYRLVVRGCHNGFKLTLLYMPKLSVRGEGAFSYIANGNIGEEWFHGRRRWRKAKRWVTEAVEGHRDLLRTAQQV